DRSTTTSRRPSPDTTTSDPVSDGFSATSLSAPVSTRATRPCYACNRADVIRPSPPTSASDYPRGTTICCDDPLVGASTPTRPTARRCQRSPTTAPPQPHRRPATRPGPPAPPQTPPAPPPSRPIPTTRPPPRRPTSRTYDAPHPPSRPAILTPPRPIPPRNYC